MQILFKIILSILFFSVIESACGQNKKLSTEDKILQDSLYKSSKKKVLNFSMKEFDALFFDFFGKKNNPDIILTKQNFINIPFKLQHFLIDLLIYILNKRKLQKKTKKLGFLKTMKII